MSQSYPLLPSAARTTTTSSSARGSGGNSRAHFLVNVTAGDAGFSVVPSVEAYDDGTAAWYPVLPGNAITTTGMNVLKVGVGFVPIAGAVASDVLPSSFRVTMTPADAKSITYSVGVKVYP